MFALHGGATGTGHIQAVIILVSIIAVIFWRDVLKILLMVAALLVIILVAFGAVVIIDGMQHVINMQHGIHK
jgi:hypothetical protein